MESFFSILAVLVEFSPPENINLLFTISIILLAIFDIVKKVDLKSQIVSVGVLGTFFGVFIGLQGFQIDNIEGSVPLILVGLKTAFATSILGMFVAILLSVIQRLINPHMDKDEESLLVDMLEAIKSQNSKFDELKSSGQIASQELSSQLNTHFEKFDKSLNSGFANLDTSFNNGFKNIDNSFKIAIDKLSQSATKEIVNSLRDVIDNFNDKLSTQFGENFKELNGSIINLLKWQESYKEHLESFDIRLKDTLNSLDKSSIALGKIESSYKDIIKVEEMHTKQIEVLNSYLNDFATLSVKSKEMLTNTESGFDKLNSKLSTFIDNFEKFTISSSSDLKSLSSSIENDFTHLKDSMRENLTLFTTDFKSFLESNSQEIADSFKTQQEISENMVNNFQSFSEEAKSIPEHLRTSLGELNGALSSLTSKFREDYEVALKNHGELLNRLINEKK